MTLHVRTAALDDTAAICGLFCASVRVWQRLDENGHVNDVTYDQLTIYERWLHGGVSGPWMSIETGAIWLNHLLLDAGLPLVAADDSGRVVAYVEAYLNNEPAPFDTHIHLAALIAADDAPPAAIDVLVDALVERARRLRCRYVTLTRIGRDATDPILRSAERFPLSTLSTVRRFWLRAGRGQVFYQAVEHPDPDAMQISGWAMPIGRLTSARHHWETLWTPLWNSLPAVKARPTNRLHLSVAGVEALVLVQAGLYDPRLAEISLWTPKPVTPPMITAISDWAYRAGYRTLSLVSADEIAAKAFGPQAERDAFQQETVGIDVHARPEQA